MKECIDSEMKKFMKSYVELFAAYHSLQHKMKQCSSDCDILFDRTVEMLQVATNCSYMKMFQYSCVCIICKFSLIFIFRLIKKSFRNASIGCEIPSLSWRVI